MIKVEHYSYSRTDDFEYHFTSAGPKGEIKKVVRFNSVDEIEEQGYFNLHFGDFLIVGGVKRYTIDDEVVSNNKDVRMIINTVFVIIYDFLRTNPHFAICLKWKDDVRVRFFNYWINWHFDLASQFFTFYGKKGSGKWEKFRKNHRYFAVYARLNNQLQNKFQLIS